MFDKTAIFNRLKTVLWHHATPYAVLAVGLGMTTLAWQLQQQSVDADTKLQFNSAVQTTQVWVERRMGRYLDVLAATRGLFVSSEYVTRLEFEIFVSSLNLKARYPGLAAIQYAPRVTPAALADFEARLAADGLAGHTVWGIAGGRPGPLHEAAGYFPVEYMEPLAPPVLGLDVGSVTMNQQAMRYACDSGAPGLGKRIAGLMEGPVNQPGFLVFVPVYHRGMPADNVEQCPEVLQGYVIGVFHAADLLAGIYDDQQHPDIDIEVFDGVHMSVDTLLYDEDGSMGFANALSPARHRETRLVNIGGYTWTLHFTSLPGLGAGPQAYLPVWILGGGILVSVLLFGIALLQARARSRAERIAADLKRSQATLAQAQQIGHMGNWDWDIARNAFVASDEACRIVGCSPRQPPGTIDAFMAAAHPDDRELLQKAIDISLQFGAVLRIDHRVVLPDGSERIVHERAHIVYDDAGRPMRMIGTIQDVTRRKRVEQEVQQLNLGLEQRVAERTQALTLLNQELEAFSYSVSHDLRAPLRAIRGFSKALLEEYAERLDDAGMDYLQRINKAGQHMSELIDDLLNLSQVTRASLHYGTVALSELASQILAERAGQDTGRAVVTQVASDIVVQGDARLLHILLDNLLGNAWKFTAGHARAMIEFGVMRQHNETVYFVRDDGAGFDMLHAHKLFALFQRLHMSTEFEGTGIGLVTAQRIVRRHGGRIWAEGAVEQGACFYFTLGPESESGASSG